MFHTSHSKSIHDHLHALNLQEGFLDSTDGDIEELAIPVDDSRPLSHYFINSSHNTYLSGNQLYGKATAEAYRKALEGGCRCVEIDVWDGIEYTSTEAEQGTVNQSQDHMHKWRPDRVEPRVLHGHTATKEVSFREVVQTIAAHAFTKTDLPLVVSLELHTNHEQQQLMVDIMREYWAPHLVTSTDLSDSTPLPSLASLRSKILIKVKHSSPPSPGPSSKADEVSATVHDDDSSSDESHPTQAGKSAIIPSLGSMGPYTRSMHFTSFSSADARIPTHIFSLSEAKLSALAHAPAQLIAHNREHMVRAYPKGARLDSSNLDPAPLWRLGVQFAALNLQSLDAATMLNRGMFGGTDGYVLKPGNVRLGTLDLKITLLAGRLAKGPHRVRAYVKMELHAEGTEVLPGQGLPDGGRVRDGQFKLVGKVAGEGREPDFGGEEFAVNGVTGVSRELAFVRFKVMNDEMLRKDELLGWACYRVERVRQGVRVVKLLDAEGRDSGGRLLVKVDVRWTAGA